MSQQDDYKMDFLVYFQWQDGYADQRTVKAVDARAARELFEELYPDCTVSQVLHYNSLVAERDWY
jgi:hypothetical protein